jgi:hypothetical protein
MRFRSGLCLIGAGALGLLAGAGIVGTSVAAATGRPIVAKQSVTHLKATSATLTARINPDGLETKYEFWVNLQPCLHLECELIVEDPEVRGEGTIPAGDRPVRVHVRLTHLWEGNPYEYWVVASNAAGTVQGPRAAFPSP